MLFSACTPLALYIHFPWCVKKCPYCDFNSHTLKTDLPEDAYIDALLADLAYDLPMVGQRKLASIFMGGGTPSLFSADALSRLLEGIRAQLSCEPDIEVTLEANPGTIERGRFADYRRVGINRISLGAQSFQPQHLKKLGRIHAVDEIYHAVDELHDAGLVNFNIDIMHGLPRQTVAEALEDLCHAIALHPTHLSWYQFTIEPNTLFYKTSPTLPREATLAEIETNGRAYLAASGLVQYEISAYSHVDKQSQHNINYWQFGDYLGIGAGAHSKMTDFVAGKVVRLWKKRQPASYLHADDNYIAGESTVSAAELPFEFMLNALRLVDGFNLQQFEERTGLSRDVIATQLQAGFKKQLLQQNGEQISATHLGWQYLNDTILLFHHDMTIK